MTKWIFALVQFFPLSIFACYAFWDGTPTVQRWLDAFEVGALLGMIQLLFLAPQKRLLNRLILAGNLYLICGGVAVFFQQWWYLEIYDALRESGIIMLLIVIGCLSTWFTSAGFIAVEGSERRLSIYLLLATLAMLFPAIIFEGQRLYAAVLPILFLACLQRYLAFIAKKRLVISNT